LDSGYSVVFEDDGCPRTKTLKMMAVPELETDVPEQEIEDDGCPRTGRCQNKMVDVPE
jgi:hypothetical protein